MGTLTVDRNTLNMITSLAHQLNTSEITIVQQAIVYYAQKAVKEEPLSPQSPKREQYLLQIGEHRPFKPFTPIKMTGEGPTASEMVIQDRE